MVSNEPFLLALERINRIILGAPTLEVMVEGVLDACLDIFDCDRAWLLFPCDPAADSFTVPIERTRPKWPGAGLAGQPVPMPPFARPLLRGALEAAGAWRLDGVHNEFPADDAMMIQFAVKSMMLMAIRPRSGAPWCLGLHHCERAAIYDDDTRGLFEALGARIADGLTGMLAYRASLADRRRLEAAQRVARLGSYEWTPDGGLYLSPQLCSLFGIPAGIVFPRLEDAMELLHVDDRGRVAQVIGGALQRGGSYEFQAHALRPGGESWIVSARGETTLGANGSLACIMGVAQDVTERVQAEEHRSRLEAQLRQSQKMQSLGQLTGGVAHDFNNLLMVISGSLEDLPHVLHDPQQAAHLITEAVNATHRGAELTRMLTAFSRQQPLSPRVVDVGDLVARVETLLRRTLGEAVSVEVVRTVGVWNCEIDPAQLENAILNLALNARDAMPRGGKLTLETANVRVDQDYAEDNDLKAGQYVLLAISDTGFGMSQETLVRAFEPFFTTKEPGRGTGLGLSMVYGFVKQSGGHVKLYSEVGEGTTAKIYLPRVLAHPTANVATPTHVVRTLGKGQLVLVVEDEPAVREVTIRMVGSLGYAVVAAGNATEALEIVGERPELALLFTDVVLPDGINGAELVRRVRVLRPGLPVLFTSGYTENAIIHHGRLDPGVTLIEKPFTRAELARRIEEALAAGP